MTDGDPEQRVRDLERGLANAAAATEYGPGTEPALQRRSAGMRLGWILLGLLVLGLLIGGGAMLVERVASDGKPVAGRATTAEVAGGGGSFTAAPPPSALPPSVTLPSATQTQVPRTYVPPQDTGGDISVAGVGKAERYDCRSRGVSVSGVDNKVILTGHCARVDVSGVGNTVTIEESDAIVVSGFNNVVTFRSGDPDLTKSGMNNTLERG